MWQAPATAAVEVMKGHSAASTFLTSSTSPLIVLALLLISGIDLWPAAFGTCLLASRKGHSRMVSFATGPLPRFSRRSPAGLSQQERLSSLAFHSARRMESNGKLLASIYSDRRGPACCPLYRAITTLETPTTPW